jgi:hypothetical protein
MPAPAPKDTGAYQGLLFSPYTGTGAAADPTLPDYDRPIRAGLGMGDTERYAKRAKVSTDKAEQHIAGAVNAVKQTMIPRSTIDKGFGSVTVKPERGRSYAGTGFTHILHTDSGPDWAALPHEMGHMQDPGVDDHLSQNSDWLKPTKQEGRYAVQKGRPDPRSEGVADAFADRASRLGSAFDSVDSMKSLHSSTGYSTEFSGWKDQHGKAAYVASRVLSTAGVEIPERDALVNDVKDPAPRWTDGVAIEKGNRSVSQRRVSIHPDDQRRNAMLSSSTPNKVLVGWAAHEHPGVIQHLEAQGLGKAVKTGLDAYRSANPPKPHAVTLATGAEGNLSRGQFRQRRHAAALDKWAAAGENKQAETLF